MKQIHELKIMPKYFDDIVNGSKTFEIRKNDRNFKAGDLLILREHNGRNYTGCFIKANITYILSDFEGLAEGYVALGMKIVNIKI